MKKTLFLHHIFAAVIACSGILHAQDENIVLSLTGNQSFTVFPRANAYTLSVTGPNNWLRADAPIRFEYMENTKIVDGELFLDNNVSIAPQIGYEKWEMGNNSSLNLGGTDAALVWFNITGESVKFDNGLINLLANQAYMLGGNLCGTARLCLKDKSRLNLNRKTLSCPVSLSREAFIDNGTVSGSLTLENGASFTWSSNVLHITGDITLEENTQLDLSGKTLANTVTLNGSATFGGGIYNGTLEVKAGKTLTLCGNLTGAGGVTLGDNATLNLNSKNFTKSVSLNGSATFGGGTYNGTLVVEAGKTLTLCGDLSGDGNIILGDDAWLILQNKTLWKAVSLEGSARIGYGTYNGTLEVKAGKTLTLYAELSGTGEITLGDNSTLYLNTWTLSKNVVVSGSASIGSGWFNGTLEVKDGNTLSLHGPLLGTGNITLGDNTTLRLNDRSLTPSVSLTGNSTIGGGTFKGSLTVAEGLSLTLLENTDITGGISLANNSRLDLGNNTLSSNLRLDGNAATVDNGVINLLEDQAYTLGGNLSGTARLCLKDKSRLDLNGKTLSCPVSLSREAVIDNGTVSGSLTLENGASFTWSSNALRITSDITLEENTQLDLSGKTLASTVTLNGSATFGGGISNGTLDVKAGKTLTLCDRLYGTGKITLGDNATLNLNGKTLLQSVSLNGSATFGGGTFNIPLEVKRYKTLTLCGDLTGTNNIIMEDYANLDLGGYTLSKNVWLDGSARIGGGTYNGDLGVSSPATLYLNRDLSGTGKITLYGYAELRLNAFRLSKSVVVTGSASINYGTIDASVTVNNGAQAHFSGEIRITGDAAVTVDGDATSVKALVPATPGLLKELTVSKGLIAGTGRPASLADGLDISRMGQDLTLENLVLTRNNKISVGDGHTITLSNVTIKISNDVCSLVNGIYTIDLKSLINCDLEMENVLLDASDLTLPQDFDLAKDAVAFDFGDDVTIKQATGLDMRLGNYWSPLVRTDEQGRVIFTKLVETPEPMTGTLSLLALAALAARRRRKR